MDLSNYLGLYATPPNFGVILNSRLARDLLQHLIVASQNLESKIIIPTAILDFKGYDGRIETANKCQPFVIKFGSDMDQVTANFCEEFKQFKADKKKDPEENKMIVPKFIEYITQLMKLADPIQWQKTEDCRSASPESSEGRVSVLVFGECGSGKSTALSLISEMLQDKNLGKRITFENAKSGKAVTT